MGRTSRRLRARELGGVAATRPAGRRVDLDVRTTCTAHGRAGRITNGAGCLAPGQVAPALGVLLVSLLAGCASAPEPLDLGPPTGVTRPALAVAPLELAFEATLDRPTYRAGEQRRQLERLVCAACGAEIEPFDAFREIGSKELAHGVDPGTRRGCPECDGDTFREPFSPPFRPRLDARAIDAELQATLRARGFTPGEGGWRLEARLESAAVRYARNGVFGLEVATFIVTALLIFPGVDVPNWFFASEDYTLELVGSWTLRAGASIVAEGVARTRTTGSFAELGPGPTREWHLVGFLRAPGCLEEDEWSEIADQLVPTAQLDFARELVRQVEAVRAP